MTVGSLLLGFLPVSLQVQTLVIEMFENNCNKAFMHVAVYGRITFILEHVWLWLASVPAGTN